MGKFSKLLFIPLLLLLCIPGSHQPRPSPQLAVVDRVDVSYRQGAVSQQRCYTSPEKMGPVLNYLRLQENLGPAKLDPERLTGDAYTVRVTMSDGGQHIYQQRSDRYFSKDYRPWHLVDPNQAADLYYLLRLMPGD